MKNEIFQKLLEQHRDRVYSHALYSLRDPDDAADLLDALEGVPRAVVTRNHLGESLDVVELLAGHSDVFASKGEVRRLVKNGGLSINKRRINDPADKITPADLLHGRFLLVQQGKKRYTLITIE